MSSTWRQKSKGREMFLVRAVTAVLNAAEMANEIWAERGLLVTRRSTFCGVVEAKARRLRGRVDIKKAWPVAE